jgi:hypothetical protein
MLAHGFSMQIKSSDRFHPLQVYVSHLTVGLFSLRRALRPDGSGTKFENIFPAKA